MAVTELAGRIAAQRDALLRPEILGLGAYHVPPAVGLLKLDAMESPYRWPPEVVAAWCARLAEVELNRYPPPNPPALCSALARHFGVPPGAGMLLGNGSDELLQLVALCVAKPGATALLPVPTFSMYRPIAIAAGLRVVEVPLRADFGLDLPALRAAIAQHRPAVSFIASPNNPTAVAYAPADLAALLDASPGLVVVDEAYAPFAAGSVLPWLRERPNLVVLRTLSKMGLAALRLGFLAAHPLWCDAFDRARLPYNIGTLPLVTAAFALEHGAMLSRHVAAIREERQRLLLALAALAGVQVVPSDANFILLRMPAGQGRAVAEALLGAGILVKDLSPSPPPLTDCLRVTVGAPVENDTFLGALADALATCPRSTQS